MKEAKCSRKVIFNVHVLRYSRLVYGKQKLPCASRKWSSVTCQADPAGRQQSRHLPAVEGFVTEYRV